MKHEINKIPITLLVDDSCPLVHVYRHHWVDVHGREPKTGDGRTLVEVISNEFLGRFCDVVERHGMAGKFSIIPSPAGRGDIVRGIEGFDPALTQEWLRTAKTRLGERFDFSPEGISHNLALNLETGEWLHEGESIWSQNQDRATLTPYLARSVELLQAAGIEPSGFTSCWVFGQKVEAEYIASMVAVQRQVMHKNLSWYFLHIWDQYPATRPYVAYAQEGTFLVSINSTVDDYFWETIDTNRTDEAFIGMVTDRLLTEDGKRGAIREVIDAGGWPVLMTHWQSYFSNGNETGLAVLDRLGQRVAAALADEVSWASCSELAQRTVAGVGS